MIDFSGFSDRSPGGLVIDCWGINDRSPEGLVIDCSGIDRPRRVL